MKKFVFLIMPLSIVLYWISTEVILWLDPSAGAYTGGELQRLFIGAAGTAFSVSITLLIIKFVFPTLYGFYNKDWKPVIEKKEEAWVLGLFLGLFVSLLLVQAIIMSAF